MFTADLAVDRVPSIRAIRNALHFGQPRAQRLREFLAAVAETLGETWPCNRRSANSPRRTRAEDRRCCCGMFRHAFGTEAPTTLARHVGGRAFGTLATPRPAP
jgi:hypothetical protein